MLRLTALAALIALPAGLRADEPPKPGPGFTALFNGKDLTGWVAHGGKLEKWGVENGMIYSGGAGGWLMTDKEFRDFELRLEYRMPRGGNSGVAVHSPLQGDPAYTGMEIQLLDDDADQYKNLRPAQYTGSIYDVVPAKRGFIKPVGEWNSIRILSKGRHLTVEMNGTVITDANLDDYTTDHGKKHPGLLRADGHLGLQDHGGRVEFRNIFVKEM
jgi:hypothetical protein